MNRYILLSCRFFVLMGFTFVVTSCANRVANSYLSTTTSQTPGTAGNASRVPASVGPIEMEPDRESSPAPASMSGNVASIETPHGPAPSYQAESLGMPIYDRDSGPRYSEASESSNEFEAGSGSAFLNTRDSNSETPGRVAQSGQSGRASDEQIESERMVVHGEASSHYEMMQDVVEPSALAPKAEVSAPEPTMEAGISKSVPLPPSLGSPKPTQAAQLVPIVVYYGTDREASGSAAPFNFYSSGKVTSLTYGSCVVTIPAVHELGELESPHWYERRKSDPTRDVTLVGVHRYKDDREFVTRLQSGLHFNSQKEIFLFIHGFDNTFEDAARRTAQLAYDGKKLHHPIGIPVMFSFPSLGEIWPWAYTRDEALLDAASYDLAQFLFTLHKNFPGVAVNVVAHSMGNHLLCMALPHYELLVLKDRDVPDGLSFGEVALEAPDEDVEAFYRESGNLFRMSTRVTLYGCSHDWGIRVSERMINGGKRIGDTTKPIFTLAPMDTIDATAIADISGHEYYVRNPDIPLLFLHWSERERNLEKTEDPHVYILQTHAQ